MEVTLLEKRIVEAEALAPILRAFIKEMGLIKVKDLVTGINLEASRKYGLEIAQQTDSATLADLANEIDKWGTGDSLEIDLLEQTENSFCFNVTRCRFAEAYEALGIRAIGTALSCCRDFGFIQGFNPKMTLTRTHTIMEGAALCDFRYSLE